ncbi:MAG: hypothetical protein WDO13_15835 [Verrucomicrobiota bacterium]
MVHATEYGTYDSTSNFVLAENVVALVIWPKTSAADQAQNGSSSLTTNYTTIHAPPGRRPTSFPPVVESRW